MITDNQTTNAIDGVDVELGMMNQTEENPIGAPVVDTPAPMS